MNVPITELLKKIIFFCPNKKNELPDIISTHALQLLKETCTNITESLEYLPKRESTYKRNKIEALLDEIYSDTINERKFLWIFWEIELLKYYIEKADKREKTISDNHFSVWKKIYLKIQENHKCYFGERGQVIINPKTLENYTKPGWDAKKRGTRESIHSVVFVLLDYFVFAEESRNNFCMKMKHLLTEDYSIESSGINFMQFGEKERDDRTNLKALIFGMWEENVFLIDNKEISTIDTSFMPDWDHLRGSYIQYFGEDYQDRLKVNILLAPEIADNFSKKHVVSVNSKYLTTLCHLVSDSPLLYKSYFDSWMVFCQKTNNAKTNPSQDEYRAFLLYYLLHEASWINFLKKNHIAVGVEFDYYLQFTDFAEDYKSTKQLLKLEQAIVASGIFVEYLQTEKKGD